MLARFDFDVITDPAPSPHAPKPDPVPGQDDRTLPAAVAILAISRHKAD